MSGEPDSLLIVASGALDRPQLLEKAERLAGSETAVHVVQVIYEGVAEISTAAIEDSQRLKSFILSSAESALEDQLEAAQGRFASLESATLWNARTWEGVLHAAENVGADLILRTVEVGETVGDRVASVVRTPDEWNLLRHSKVPVVLVKPQVWGRDAPVICALDAFDETHDDLSRTVLRRADQYARRLGVDLDLVYAYPLFEPWVGELGAVKSYAEIKASVEEDAKSRLQALADSEGVSYRHMHLEEGQTAQVLARLTEDADAALLVVGTHAREGMRGVLLGNTSERILHAVDCDVATVPTPS